MEFKSIDQLTIKDCIALLAINENQFKARVSKVKNVSVLLDDRFYIFGELSEQQTIIKNKFKELVYKDRMAFLGCSSVSEYNNYISSNEFGLWRNESFSIIKQINDREQEKNVYLSCKGNIKGLKKYIRLYPHGIYYSEATRLLEEQEKSTRIKKIVFSLIAITLFFFICYLNYEPSSYIRTNENVSFSNRGGEAVVDIFTDALDGNLTSYCSSSWLTTELSGSKLRVKAETNHGNGQTTSVTLRAFTTLFGFNLWSEEFIVHVSQESGLASYLSVSKHDCIFDKYGNEEYNIKISTDGLNLKIEKDADWISLEKSYDDDGKVVSSNLIVKSSINETDSREAYINITSDNYSETIIVRQSSGLATYFSVSPASLIMAEEGTDESHYYPIKVSTDGTTWSITDSPYWLTAEPRISSGEIRVTLSHNTGRIKTGTITVISNNGDSYDVNVKQLGDPSDFSASSSTLKFGSSSDYENVSIENNSNKPIYASSDKSWIGTTVLNNNRIKISCSSTSESPRKGTVTVTCGNEKLSIVVTQDGWTECTRCRGDGEVNCTNYQAQWRYYPAWGSTYHQVYVQTGTYYSFGAWFPQYGWENCSTCGGDGKIRCSKCDGKGKIRKSY